MGWWDKVKATSAEAAKAAKEAVDSVVAEVETEFGDQDWYREAKSVGREIGEFGKDVWDGTTELVGETLDDLGKTEGGKVVGDKSRQFVGFLSKLPVLSIATDVMRARNGIDGLYEHLQEDPADPQRHLWLAEAIERMARDQTRYTAVRGVLDPTYVVARQAVKTSAELGQEGGDDTRIRLLKNAFALSIERLRADPADRAALHILARVYLGQRHLGEATRFCKLSVLADPADGEALVTLGRVYLALDQEQNARKSAELAIERDSSVGYEILADLTVKSVDGDAGARIEAYSDLLDRVQQPDRTAYWGPSVEGMNMVDAVGAAQMKKATDLLDRLW